MLPDPAATAAYYRAAVLGLRALEARERRGRRFGAEADERWQRLTATAGASSQLHAGDRLQLLVREAAADWPIAFAASHVFRLPGVAPDDPFGPDWSVPSPVVVDTLLGRDEPPTLANVCKTLGIPPLEVRLPDLRPGTRLVLAGGSAIRAAAEAFDDRQDLDWAAQVTVVADWAAHRQLAGLASILVGAARACAVVASDQRLPSGAPVIGPDAEPGCMAALS